MRKNIFWILAFCIAFISATYGQGDAIDRLFKDKSSNKDFEQVVISSDMLAMISNSDKNIPETKSLLQSLKGIKILKTDKNAMAFYTSAKAKISSSGYKSLMSVKDQDSLVDFYSLGSNGKTVKELVMVLGSNKLTTIFSFTGNINLNDVSKLGKILNIDNTDKLKKLDR